MLLRLLTPIGLWPLVVVSLVGCVAHVALPPPLPALDLPSAWSTGNLSVPVTTLDRWWQAFDDPLLDGLVQRALDANPRVLGADATLQQARALRRLAAAGMQPLLGLSASARHGSSGGHSTGTQLSVGLDASWAPDLGGEQRQAVDAAEASRRARLASLGDVQLQVAVEVSLNYLALRGLQARLLVAQDNLAAQQQTLQLTAWREQAGLLSTLETDQARSAAAQTAAALPLLRASIEQSLHALAVLTGQVPLALSATLGPGPGAAPAVLRLPADPEPALPAEALRQRPDLRAAEFEVQAAVARLLQADAARQPSFTLGGSIGASALTLASLATRAALVTSLLAGVSLPLADGGAGLARVQAQQAALAQAEATYRATLLTALQQVEDALTALRAGRQRLDHLQQAALSAADASRLARQRYDSGLVDFQVVLDTQRSRLGTQDSLITAQADLGTQQLRLIQALGGGWRLAAEPGPSANIQGRLP